MKNLILTGFCLLALSHTAFATFVAANADSATATTASGTLNGTSWTATTSSSAPFLGVNLPTPSWNANAPLPVGALSLTASAVNAGDFQEFTFSAPVANTFFYIENFDSNSIANITSDANLQLIAASPSISFDPGSGILSSSNGTFNGEGDAIFQVNGPLSSLRLDYTAGNGSNGVYYGFGQNVITSASVTAVPEPSAFLYWSVLLGGVGMVYRWKRMNQIESVQEVAA